VKPNILFIVIDSLRADKCYGPDKTSKTSNIDSLINKGVIFTQAISSVSATSPILASILTGLQTFNSGMNGETYHKLNPTIKTYVQILKEFGYHTFAVFPKILLSSGVIKDFEDLELAYPYSFRLFSGLGPKILKKLESIEKNQPWFCFIHLSDLHQPIIIPKEYQSENFGKNQYEKMVSFMDYWIGAFFTKN